MKLSFPILAAALLAVLVASCRQAKVDRLQTGDLVFVGLDPGYSLDPESMDSAISSATCSPDMLNIIHVAIADVDSAGRWIIDATIKRGVARYPLDSFLVDFTLKDGSYPVFIVKRLKDDSHAAEYVANALKYVGRTYDRAFLPDDDSLYCSELVRDSYVTAAGEYLFKSYPMNFNDAEGNLPLYWEQLFALLGMPVPQGVEGTNPKAMSDEDILRDVDVSIVPSME